MLNTKYGLLNKSNSQCYISYLFCIRVYLSLLITQQTFEGPIYIYTISSHVNSSSTIHFIACVLFTQSAGDIEYTDCTFAEG